MLDNAKTDSNFINQLNLDRKIDLQETETQQAAARARQQASRKLMPSPSSTVIWSVLIGSAILVSVTFLLLY